MSYAGSLSAMLPWLIDDVEEIDRVFGGDAFPYGIEANRATLQALVTYMVEQHFIVRAIPIEDPVRCDPGGKRYVTAGLDWNRANCVDSVYLPQS